ncbi:MAG TPA: hypothetical protein VGV89_00980 [Thermoplasmata archaeon]|nr:hypothetical protein [Thermoplasmata archaeon]
MVGWYSTSFSASESFGGVSVSATGTYTFYPGSSYHTTTSVSCSGSPLCGSIPTGTNTTSYSSSHLTQTGNWYALVEYLTIGGLVLGLLGALLGFMSRGKPGMQMAVLGLIALALILSIATPMLLLAEQPGAVSSDCHNNGGSNATGCSTGPGGSFFGSCSGSSCAGTFLVGSGSSGSWGPSTGWYLSIVAFVLFLIGLLLFLAGRKEPEPMAAPMGQPSMMGGTPGAPPSPPGAGTNTCAMCGMSFATAEQLAEHAKSVHGVG